MDPVLRLLHIEDSDDDSLLVRRQFIRSGYQLQWKRVDTAAGLETALEEQPWDVILSDYVMPQFSAPAALAILKARNIDVPFIIVSGAIGEETAVAAMRSGAHDYLMKDNLARLVPVVEREIQECSSRTERARTEEALRASEKLVSLGRLAASIAHEVNNPLEAVTNVLYLLGRRNLDATAREYLRIAEHELERVTSIVRQALSFTRIATDHVPVPISSLLHEVERLYLPRIQAANVYIDKRFDFDAAVPGELRQVFSNLLVNAVEAVGENGTVRVHVARASGGPHQSGVRLTIADNGPGIPPEWRRDIFQPFFSTKREKGNGLGLWICSEIVRKHGGVIRMHSSVQPGRSGTVFSVLLPKATPLASGAAAG